MKKTKFKLEGYKPITFKELRDMSESDHKNLLSFCWKYGDNWSSSVGIKDVSFTESGCDETYTLITWNDSDGDPQVGTFNMNEKIEKVGNTKWSYGLYKKRNK